MDPLNSLLLIIHLLALAAGGAGAVVMPVVGAQSAVAPAEARPMFGAIARRVQMAGRGALVTLIVTGVLLFWLKWDFSAPSMLWFGVKMALVLVLAGAMVIGGVAMKRAQQGDTAARATTQRAGMISGLALLGVVVAAVLTFG